MEPKCCDKCDNECQICCILLRPGAIFQRDGERGRWREREREGGRGRGREREREGEGERGRERERGRENEGGSERGRERNREHIERARHGWGEKEDIIGTKWFVKRVSPD